MSGKITFKLVDTSLNQELGEVTFKDGDVYFRLDKSVQQDQWNRIGFIPLSNARRSTNGQSIYYFLNSRLPLKLRDAPQPKKIDYIKKFGLKVASDSFTLLPV